MRLPVISKALQRYRVSRGYGVHSPFAYRFIIRVLRETLPYYGFDRLNSLRGDMSAADARLLFRITDCRVQTARARKGMEFHPCKSVGELEYGGFAAALDDRIQCACASCFPDITDEACNCAWRFWVE